MQTLSDILADSFAIWSRNFALMYIFLFFSLLIVGIWPESETPSLEPRWILLFAVLILLSAAFMAGWFNMISSASQRYFTSQKGKPVDVGVTVDAFKLFGDFLPGVGRFFGSFAVGTLIQAAVAGLIIYAVWDHIGGNLPLFEKIAAMQPVEREAYMGHMPRAEQLAIGEAFLAILVGAAVFAVYTLLTMFWQAYIVFCGHSAPGALWMSVRQFFRDPLRILGLGLFFLMLQLLLTLVMASSPVAFVVGQFFSLMAEIYMAIVLVVYVMSVSGKPVGPVSSVAGHDPEQADDLRDNP